jgi:hypothetical protein
MSKTMVNVKVTRAQRLCTLWTHDDNFSRDDIVFNGEKFPEIPTAPGTLLQIVGIDSGTAVRDFQTTAKTAHCDTPQVKGDNIARDAGVTGHPSRTRRGSITITTDENVSTFPDGRGMNVEKAYVFAVTAVPADLRSKYANLQVSCGRQRCVQSLTDSAVIDIREDRQSVWVS